MKASEYKKIFDNDPSIETLANIGKMFIEEIKTLSEIRHAKSNEAMISIIKEQDNKWRVLCRMIDGLKPNGFKELIRCFFPLVYPLVWMEKDEIKIQ